MNDQIWTQLNARFDTVDRRFDKVDARMDKLDEAIVMLIRAEAQWKGMIKGVAALASIVGGMVALVVKFLLEKV